MLELQTRHTQNTSEGVVVILVTPGLQRRKELDFCLTVHHQLGKVI